MSLHDSATYHDSKPSLRPVHCNKSLEDLPTFESTHLGGKRQSRTATKHSPIVRWLHKQVNKPWAEVYSLLSADKSEAGQRLRMAVLRTVDLKDVKMVGGMPYTCKYAVNRVWNPIGTHRHDAFYVNPDTGILSVVKHTPVQPQVAPIEQIILSSVPAHTVSLVSQILTDSRIIPYPATAEYVEAYRLIDGIWYYCTSVQDKSMWPYKHQLIRILTKRQLCSKELKKNKLSNTI